MVAVRFVRLQATTRVGIVLRIGITESLGGTQVVESGADLHRYVSIPQGVGQHQ